MSKSSFSISSSSLDAASSVRLERVSPSSCAYLPVSLDHRDDDDDAATFSMAPLSTRRWRGQVEAVVQVVKEVGGSLANTLLLLHALPSIRLSSSPANGRTDLPPPGGTERDAAIPLLGATNGSNSGGREGRRIRKGGGAPPFSGCSLPLSLFPSLLHAPTRLTHSVIGGIGVDHH